MYFIGFLVPILVLVLRPLRIFLMTVNEEPVLLNWFPSPNFGAVDMKISLIALVVKTTLSQYSNESMSSGCQCQNYLRPGFLYL